MTFLNATGTGRVLDSQSTATLVSGSATFSVNGEIVSGFELERPGRGLRTVPCEATASFTSPNGNAILITIVDAQFLLTPPGAP